EALAAEALEQRFRDAGEAAVLEHARGIAGDESRWAEPYALLAGRVEEPDALVRALVRENRALGLRSLATAQGLKDDTLSEILELSDEWKERVKVYERIPELLDDPQRALALIDQLRQRIRDGNDLFFLDQAVGAVAKKWPDTGRLARQLQSRFYDHIPAPAEDLFQWIETTLDGRVPLWREIPAGSFQMGSPPDEEGRDDDEGPRHQVTVTSAFALGTVPVTNAQYAAFDPGHEPSRWEGVSAGDLGNHPVETVTWYEAMVFCRWLSAVLPWARDARLPTEEEWEYACRAESETRYWRGDGEADLDRVGWYSKNSEKRTHRVGDKPANPWGLYDVHGNVWEWTSSVETSDYSGRQEGIVVNPSAIDPADLAAPSGEGRVIR
ncbi:MAG: formylglycine-generating enzyme family protein, partial [bacterium]|nr:formylglycine-generating enzyme family protein [bacterium]